MNYENWISYRYLKSSKGRFLSFLNFISVAGVATGVMSLIVVTGVMTGFGNNLREKIIGTMPHLVVEKENGVTGYRDVVQQVAAMDGVVGSSAYVQGNLFLESEGQAMGVMLRGVDPQKEGDVTRVQKYLEQGQLRDLEADGILIGSELARYFGYGIGDTVTLIAPGSGMSGRGWRYQLTVAGVFNTGMVDYDMSLLIASLPKAQEIFNFAPDRVSGIGVRIKDPYAVKEAKEAVYQELGYSYMVKTWIDVNRNLFEALFLEKWGLFIILTLMVLIASFNIISTLIVTVSSKVHDIGILKSFGVTNGAIRRIFTRQGIFIGLKGTVWGVVLGVAISYVLRTYIKVPAEIYSIDHVPVQIQLSDLLVIVGAAMLISFAATIYPAARAACLQPVEALRYE